LAGEIEGLTTITRMQHRDGHWVWLENLARGLRDRETGEVCGIVAVFRDISDRKAIEEELADANRRLEILATRDGLTGLANRRTFDETFDRECRRARRDGCDLAVIMIDVDRFKTYNDHYGHPAGDACLRRVADAIGSAIRGPSDFAARYGGEEFVVLLPGTHEAGAAEIAERIRLAVRELKLTHASGAGGIVTISAGVSASPKCPRRDERECLLRDADQALYKAKNAGRDQVRNASCVRPYPIPSDVPAGASRH
jgi:diguanylate cyclase (GGDEF)-like protein